MLQLRNVLDICQCALVHSVIPATVQVLDSRTACTGILPEWEDVCHNSIIYQWQDAGDSGAAAIQIGQVLCILDATQVRYEGPLALQMLQMQTIRKEVNIVHICEAAVEPPEIGSILEGHKVV
jgi:hypothetical protein